MSCALLSIKLSIFLLLSKLGCDYVTRTLLFDGDLEFTQCIIKATSKNTEDKRTLIAIHVRMFSSTTVFHSGAYQQRI